MVCLGRIEKKESYLGALPEQGISCLRFSLLNQNATGTETNIQVHIRAKLLCILHLATPQLQQLEVTAASGVLIFWTTLWFSVPDWQ